MKYRIREQNELKASGLHWIDYLPKDWKKASLKYILNYVIGSTPSTSKDKYFFGDNIWVSISDIKDKYISDAKQRLSDEAIIDCNIKKVPKGSLLYSFKLSVGQMSFNTVDLYTNEAIASFINNENVNLDFWYYALGKYLIEYSNENIYGAKLLNQDLIKNARLLVPLKIEQQKIANFLDEKSKIFDEAISKKEQLISKLEFVKQSLISEVVTGKLKVIEQNSKLQTIKREQNELKPSGVEWLGDIPKDWIKTKLKYLCSIKGRIGFKGFTKDDLVDKNKGALVLGATEIMDDGKINLSKVQYISWDKYYESPEIMIKKNELLIVQRGSTVGKVAFINQLGKEATINPSLVLLKNINIEVKYLFYFLKSSYIKNIINVETSSTAIPMISQTQISNYVILEPFLNEQQKISKYLDEKLIHFDNTIEKTKQSIKKLKLAKEALISQAVTGKIEVL